MKQYNIKWNIETGKFKKEDAEEDEGLTDQLVLISIIKAEQGDSKSMMVVGCDGETHLRMSAEEEYEAWVAMAQHLLDNKLAINSPYRAVVVEALQQAIAAKRPGGT